MRAIKKVGSIVARKLDWPAFGTLARAAWQEAVAHPRSLLACYQWTSSGSVGLAGGQSAAPSKTARGAWGTPPLLR